MISIADEEIVLERRTSTERFLLFTSTDSPKTNPLPYWGVTIDVGGDAVGILVRLDARAAPDGWTAGELLRVVLQMTQREREKPRGLIRVEVIERHVEAAIAAAEKVLSGEADRSIDIEDDDGSLYAYGTTEESPLWLCPNPEDVHSEGISAEALLVVVDQMMDDAAKALPPDPILAECRRHTRLALAAEVRRVQAIRSARSRPVRPGR